MKNKIKKVLSIILSLVMVLSLFGCSKDNNDDDETKGTTENNETIGANQEENSLYAEDQVLFVAQNRYDLEEDSHIIHFYNYNGVHLEALDTSISTAISLKCFAKNGLTPAMDTSNGKYGYINKDGSFIIDAKYDEAYSFSDDGLALVMCEEKYENAYNNIEKYGYINSKGEEIIPCIYDCATSFYPSGYAIVGNCDFQIVKTDFGDESDYVDMSYVESSNYRYGVIDKKGNLTIEQKYQFIDHISDKYILCKTDEHHYDIYDISGTLIYEINSDDFDGFYHCYVMKNEVYVVCKINNELNYWKFNQREFVEFDDCDLGKNINLFSREDSLGKIKFGVKHNGNEVVFCEYDYIYSVKDYFVAVKYTTARGRIDIYNSKFEKTAEELNYSFVDRNLEYGKHAELPNGYFCVGDGNDKYGIIDYTGKIIVEPVYENVGFNSYNSTGNFDVRN
ncbi:MAG: WG repeat-containing protein [Clostridia bacterium]|nr:WG repeat-containing protein [Clostridia bacterium]